MKSVCSRWALAALALPMIVGGCASQATPGDSAAAATASTARTPPSASAVPAASTAGANAAKHTLAEPTALETQYGIQIAQVGLAASGGLVDVRFKVLDAAKAKALLANPANTPQLIAGDKPPLMAPHHALKGARFSPGQIFYILYPNTRNAVQSGTDVTVAMGDLRLGPVKAQ